MESDPPKPTQPVLRLGLIGRLTVSTPDGKVINISSKRGRALLALLAVAPSGRRERRWLQYKLWSTRGDREGSGSLRQCLSGLKRALGDNADVLIRDRTSVGLDLSRIDVDVDNLATLISNIPAHANSEFLEGLDIADPEFDDWLREQRAFWEGRIEDARQSGVPEQIDADVASAAVSADSKSASDDIPVIAVMPFRLLGDAQVAPHVIDGVLDEIIDQLARVRLISVIARGSSMASPNAHLSPSDFGKRVGANYVVVGEVRRFQEETILEIELLRVPGSDVLWRHGFTLSQPTTLARIRDVSLEIAGNVSSHVSREAEMMSQSNPLSENSEVSDMIWKGRWHLHRLTKADAREARRIFERLIASDVRNAEAHLHLAWSLLWEAWATRATPEHIRRIVELGQKAITLDNADGRAFWVVGTAESWVKNIEMADHYIDQAIKLCPSHAFAYLQRATNRIYSGKPDEAIAPVDIALRLSPFDTQKFVFHGERAMAHLLMGDNAKALDDSMRALMLRRSYWYAHLIRALALWRTDEADRAREAYRLLTWHKPNFDAEFMRWLPFLDRGPVDEMNRDLVAISLLDS